MECLIVFFCFNIFCLCWIEPSLCCEPLGGTLVCNSFAVCGSCVKQVSHSWHIVLDTDTLYTFLNFITQFISLLNLHLEPELIIVNIDIENLHSVYRSLEIHNCALTSSPLSPLPPPPPSSLNRNHNKVASSPSTHSPYFVLLVSSAWSKTALFTLASGGGSFSTIVSVMCNCAPRRGSPEANTSISRISTVGTVTFVRAAIPCQRALWSHGSGAKSSACFCSVPEWAHGWIGLHLSPSSFSTRIDPHLFGSCSPSSPPSPSLRR